MNTLQTFWNGLDWSVLTDMLVSVIPALLCITLHELSHGFAAWCLGDMTAKNAGRLTLNPIRHIDIMGLLMMIVFKFGWAKPVPVDMRNFKRPRRDMAITAMAGPLCNLILAALLLFVYGLVYYPLAVSATRVGELLLQTIATTAYLSLALAVFNLIPISPLDGSKVLFSFLSEEHYYKLMRYERYGMILLLIVVATGVLGSPLSGVTGFLYNKLFWLAERAFGLVTKFFI